MIRKGKCTNLNCEKALRNEIQEIEIDEQNDFVCEECGGDLEEIQEKKRKKSPLFLWLVIGAIIIIGIIIILIFGFNGSDSSEIMPPDAVEAPIDSTDMLKEVSEPESVEVPTPKKQQSPNPSKSEAASKSGTHNVGYGTWSGSLKNGQPHGMGTLTYSTGHLIDSRDSKGRVAQPGEYIVGEWDNGHLVQGRWFKNDGTKEAVIIGKAG